MSALLSTCESALTAPLGKQIVAEHLQFHK